MEYDKDIHGKIMMPWKLFKSTHYRHYSVFLENYIKQGY